VGAVILRNPALRGDEESRTVMEMYRARFPDFWGPVDPLGVQRPDFAQFTLSEMTKILRLRLRMTANGRRMTAGRRFSPASKGLPFPSVVRNSGWKSVVQKMLISRFTVCRKTVQGVILSPSGGALRVNSAKDLVFGVGANTNGPFAHAGRRSADLDGGRDQGDRRGTRRMSSGN
jgi:hypothetical protein